MSNSVLAGASSFSSPRALEVVMAGLDPAIHDLLFDRMKTWMPAPSAGTTVASILGPCE
jgi:hypothetical protein